MLRDDVWYDMYVVIMGHCLGSMMELTYLTIDSSV